METYLNIARTVLRDGIRTTNRTGVETIAIPGTFFEHDMCEGFPLLTTKRVPFRLVASELEFFIKGMTDKRWMQERNNHIWDEWCCPKKVSYAHDEHTQNLMKAEHELGPIYGWQWRNFGGVYESCDKPPRVNGIDQLKILIERLKTDPTDRRMIVSAWNPVDFDQMALPPCHYAFQVVVLDGALNLMWNQRSVDVALGLPFNIASYALLLHLIAKESGYKEGKLIGFLGNTHVYVNHVDGLNAQLLREPMLLPIIQTPTFSSIFDWEYTDSIVCEYQSHPRISFEIAV